MVLVTNNKCQHRQVLVAPEVYVVHTMTATVMVPPSENSCNQWISFSAENEPILNNAPDVDDGCDTFLKRLQRTKLANTDPSLAAGQFCFEAVVDKRYNRWKRRRRKKKDCEHRRAVRPIETESSDDNDDRNPEVEQILDQMYDQIHGPAPLTPNGTRDTPRLRNRRRRKEEREHKEEVNMASSSDAAVSNYDASSEWTSSEKDCAYLSSSSGLGQCTENVNSVSVRKPTERKSSEDLCCWPFLEQYKQEILQKIQNTPAEQLEQMDQKDWLPDITSHYNGRTSKASQRSDKDDTLDDLEAKTLSEFTSLRSRERSNSTSTLKSDTSAKVRDKPGTPTKMTKAGTSNMYKKWTRNQQPLRNTYPPSQSTKLLSRTEASSWSEMGTIRQKSAGKIGLVAVGQNDLDNTFKASLRPIKRDDTQTSQGQPKQTNKKPTKEQAKVRTGLNLPALSKNLKSQTFLTRQENITKVRKKPQTPVSDKPTQTKQQQLSRPKTQPGSTKKENRDGGVMDPNLIFRDYYLKTLYGDRARINSHIGPYASGKHLKKALTVDQLDIGRRKNRTDEDKLSDLAFTRSFTFSMFDLPEVYKMYNSNLVRKANGEVIDSD